MTRKLRGGESRGQYALAGTALTSNAARATILAHAGTNLIARFIVMASLANTLRTIVRGVVVPRHDAPYGM